MDLLQDALARRDNLLQAFNRNPDQAAELRRIAQETNTPAGFVDDHTRALHRLNGLEQSLSGLSILPTAIRRSLNFATLAQDDMETLASLEKVSQARQRRRAQQEKEAAARYEANQPGILAENRDNFFAGFRDFFNKRDLKTAVERQAELEQFNRGEGFEGLHYQISELEKAAAEEGGMDKLSPEAQQQYRELIARREGMAAEIMGERDQAIADYLEDAASIAAVPRSDKTQAQMEALGQMQGADKFFYALENPRTLAQTVSGSAGYMAPALAATVGATATAGPGAGMAVAGAGSYIGERSATIADRLEQLAQARGGLSGLRLEEVRDLIAGADVDEIISAANRRGAAVGLFDALSMGVAGKIAGWGSRTGRHVSAAGAGIAASMGMGAAGEAAGQIADRGEVHDWGDVGLEAVAEIATGGTELASAYAHLGIEGMKKEQATDLDNLTAMTDAARASKLNQRAPDVFRGLAEQIEENADIRHYYVDGNALHQSGLVAALEEALPDRVGEIRQALATGGTVQIPAADILTKIAPDKGLEDAIKPHLRTADGLSLHELETTGQAELEQDIRNEVTRLAAEDTRATEIQALEQSIIEQLNTAGQTTTEANRTYATLYAASVDTLSRRMGISPQEYHAQYGIHIVGGQVAIRTQAGEQTLSPAEAARQLAAGAGAAVQGGQNAGTAGNTQVIDTEVVSEVARFGGMDIAGYQRAIAHDAVAIQQENGKKQNIPLTDADRTTISDTITTPDVRLYGLKTPDGQRALVSVKALPEGGVAVVEEVLAGGKTLAVKSLRRYTGDTEQTLKALREESWQRGNRETIFDVPVTPRQASAQNSYQQLDETADSAFAQAVDDVVAGRVAAGYIDLGTTPEVLKLVGVPDGKVRISGGVIEKAVVSYLDRHNSYDESRHAIRPEDLKRLPANLNDPIAVFKSATRADSFVVLTELMERESGRDKPVIAALHLKKGKRGLDLVDIASVYGRSNRQLVRAFDTDLLYLNKQKGQQFLNTHPLQLHWDLTSDADLSARNVKTNDDLSQAASTEEAATQATEAQAAQQNTPAQDSYQQTTANTAQAEEFETTAQQYGGEVAYNAAKAAGQTELNYRQWVQVRTPSFKAWFGDWQNDPENASKVVNPQTGEPQVVYHSTLADFDVFQNDRNIHFVSGDPKFVEKFIVQENGEMARGANIMPLFVAAKNPFDYSNKTHVKQIAMKAGLGTGAVSEVKKGKWQRLEDRTVLEAIKNSGLDGLYVNEDGIRNLAVFSPEQLKSATGNSGAFDPADANIYHQDAPVPRGAFSPDTNTITLTPNADLSTFIHELGHYFLETLTRHASELRARNDAGEALTDGQKQIINDADRLLANLGGLDLDTWHSMTIEEKRSHHELAARQFETYVLEGKAPSLELQGAFQRFRAWLLRIYKAARNLNAPLNDEVRQVFDRMLATSDAIELAEQNRSMMQIFDNAEEAGMTAEQFADYQRQFQGASDAALDEMSLRMLGDAKAIARLKHKALKAKSKEAKILRHEAEIEARNAIMAQPVYRVWQMLSGKMNADTTIASNQRPWTDAVAPEHDDLFTAIAKIGGINRQEIERTWGFDPADKISPVKPGFFVLRREGGQSLDGMRQALVQYGYLTESDSLNDFYELFEAQRRGDTQYSNRHQPDPGSGKTGEHAHLHDLPSFRLDYASLAEMGYGDEQIAALGRKVKKKGGIHPDLLAELVMDADGNPVYDSGDALVQALLAAPEPKSAVRAFTDRIMLERHGELATPEAISEAADMAAHNDLRLRVLATEYNALAQASGGARLVQSAARQLAAQAIGQKRIRDLSPAQYTRMETRAAKAALAAMKKGDIATAAAEKRNQVLQASLARAAHEAKVETKKHALYLRRMNKLDPKTVAIEEREQIEALLERYNLRDQSGKALDRRQSLAEWVQAQREQGIEPDIAPEMLDELKRQPWQTLTVDELRGLVDTVRQIEHRGRTKNELLTARKKEDYNTAIENMVASIDAHARVSGIENRTPTTKAGKAKAAVGRFFAAHLKTAMLARRLDGDTDGGAVWEYFIRPANAAADRETTMRAEATAKLTEILAPLIRDRAANRKKSYQIAGKTRSFTHNDIFVMALNRGNEGNLQRLLGGENWEETDLAPLFAELTAADWQAVQAIWDYFETYRPAIAAKERRVNGIEPQWVAPTPFAVRSADGQIVEMRGGYYPIRYDTQASERAAEDDAASAVQAQMRGVHSAATTRRGHTKSRVKEVHNRPLVYNFAGIYSGFSDVIHDLAWHEYLIDANKLLRSTRLQNAVKDHYGTDILRQFKTWIQDIAVGDNETLAAGEDALRTVRRYASMAGLAFNVVSALKQPLGILQSVARVGGQDILGATAQFIRNPVAMTREAQGVSAFMKNRARTRFRELNELRNALEQQNAIRQAMGRYGYVLIMAVQQQVDVITWHAQLNKSLRAGADIQDAVAQADQAVIDSQGSGMTKDLAAIERGGEWRKLFTVYYGFMNTVLNLEINALTSKRSLGYKAGTVLMLSVAMPIIDAALSDLLKPGDSDDWDEDHWQAAVGKAVANSLTGHFFALRELQFGGRSYSGPTGTRSIADAYKLIEQTRQGELDDGFRRALINIAGSWYGLPSAQLNRSWDGFEALDDGKTDNPLALIFGYKEKK